MRQYELTYLVSDLVPENELNKVTGKVGGYLRDLNGEIVKEEIWGRRKLAYPIQKQEFATYVTIIFNLPADKAKEFEHNIQMTGKIIRHLMIVKEFGQEGLKLSAEDIVDTETIKEVIGGKKSLETVKNKTEESKDLMAVRGKSEDKKEKVKEEIKEPVVEAKVEIEKPVKEKKNEKKTETADKSKKAEDIEKKAKNKTNEADRLSKLDKELDSILGKEL